MRKKLKTLKNIHEVSFSFGLLFLLFFFFNSTNLGIEYLEFETRYASYFIRVCIFCRRFFILFYCGKWRKHLKYQLQNFIYFIFYFFSLPLVIEKEIKTKSQITF